MYDVRERIIQNKINFLLIVATFLPILSITLYTTDLFNDEVILIPIIFQLIAIMILLMDFFNKGKLLHWFELEKTIRLILDNKLHTHFFCNLKALEAETFKNMEYKHKHIIKPALYLIILSLFAICLSVITIIFHISLHGYMIILILCILFVITFFYYYNPREANMNQEYENCKKKLNNITKK